MKNDSTSNISVAANIWADASHPNQDPGRYAALQMIPGDLRVNLLGSRDKRNLQQVLTVKQYHEYCYCRFFAPHGQTGTAYERR